MRTEYKKILALLMTLTVTGCSPPASLNSDAQVALAPKPQNLNSEFARLTRYRGQTEFLNYRQNYAQSEAKETGGGPPPPPPPSGDSPRTEQEADIFKVGKPGSKLLFLLNNHRGLQVISYEDGPEAPKLVGRAKASSNSVDQMYYEAKHDRLIVLERVYLDDNGNYLNEAASRLVVYDVSEPTHPKVASTISVEGSIADSRIVGDILYLGIAHSKHGEVVSFSLASKKIEKVKSYRLNLPVSQRENMSIQTVKKGDEYKYYLLAALSETGWWDRQSAIEVIDISSEEGDIAPVMAVAAKGFIRERSQMLIKNNTLIVTSNYMLPSTGDREIARIAVETFKFPTSDSEILTADEAQFRKLNIDRSLKNLSGLAYEEKLQEMTNDPELGLKGRFLQVDAQLKKIMPDSAVTVGDGSGLSANLQDVRYQGDYLYAFWVPANEIDPFDLFDISNPEEGVKYISRLQFDGWISRAIPFEVKGRKLILGLGWIVPVVNNETNRRQPQAMIFEVGQFNGKLRALDVAQFSFENSNIWTDFNGQDKMIEVRMTGETSGEVLFAAHRWTKDSSDGGGQILKFDLGAIIEGKNENALKKGPFLSGGSDWIRRVFTNTEIDRINSFSDKALATFSSAKTDSDTLKAVHMLELARNIRGYEVLNEKNNELGVQIISDYSYEAGTTQLRLVDVKKVDSEKHEVKSQLTLSGSYQSHFVNKTSGDLVIVTTENQSSTDEKGNYKYSSTTALHRVKLSGGALLVDAKTDWTTQGQSRVLQLRNGEFLSLAGQTLKLISPALVAENLKLENCNFAKGETAELAVTDGTAYLKSEISFSSKEFKDVELTQSFVSKLSVSKSSASCGSKINVPGEIKMITTTGEILTLDSWVQDIKNVEEKSEDRTGRHRRKYANSKLKDSLLSFKVRDGKAYLQDEAEASLMPRYGSTVHSISEREVVHAVKSDRWGKPSLDFLAIDQDGFITHEVHELDQVSGESAALMNVVKNPKRQNAFLALLSTSAGVQALEFSNENRAPVTLSLRTVNERFEVSEPASFADVGQSRYGYYGSDRSIHFNQKLFSFEIAGGLRGMTQVFVDQKN